jgi:iron complex outermembrane receptor protein
MAPPGMTAPTYNSTRYGKGTEKGAEVRMTSSVDSRFEWILGGNMYKAEDEQHQVNENADDPDAALEYNDQWNNQDTKALYGNLKYPFTDRFRGTIGARKSWDENATTNYEVPGKGGVAETLEGSSMEYDSPNYNIGAEYDVSENSMLYTNIVSSYRLNAGGVTPGGVQLPPEELMAYTIGAKNRFFGNKLQLNVSAYYYDYADYYANMPPSRIPVDYDQDGEWDPATETDMEELVNMETGDAVVYGFDIQTSTIITDKDKLDFSISYIKKYFEDLVFDFPDMVNWFGIDDLDYSDKDMPQAPNWRLSASYNRNFTFQNGGVITARLEANYTTETCLNWMAKSLNMNIDTATGTYTAYVSDTSNTRWQEAYHIENFALTYMNPDGKWTLSAYVNNLTNYAVKRFLDGMGNMMVGNPRTYGAVLSVRY